MMLKSIPNFLAAIEKDAGMIPLWVKAKAVLMAIS
jgi:hypothetical protein